MRVNDALEENAVEIKVGGRVEKVSEIEGLVTGVMGFNEPIEVGVGIREAFIGGRVPSYIVGHLKYLSINLDSKTSTHQINLVEFHGTSPVRVGDRIRAGLIVHLEFPKKAIYVGILQVDGSYQRIDFMDGYEPKIDGAKKLRLGF